MIKMYRLVTDVLGMVQSAVDHGWGHTVRLSLLISVVSCCGGLLLTLR